MTVIQRALALTGEGAQHCAFCDGGWSYDLSALSAKTFIVPAAIPPLNSTGQNRYAYFVRAE